MVNEGGFDPARWRPDSYEGKPRQQPKEHRDELNALLKVVQVYTEALPENRLAALFEAFKTVSPINCSWQHYALAKAFIYDTAAEIEARAKATPNLGARSHRMGG
jgi:hypothetical protein